MLEHTLLDDHARIVAAVDANVRMISRLRPETFDSMASTRWAFTREFLLHCARDDAHVLRPLMNDRRPHVAAAAAASQADLQALVETFKAHVKRWAGGAAAAEWETYVRVTTTLMTRIRRRLSVEERELYGYLPAQPPAQPAATTPTLSPTNYAGEAWAIHDAIFTGKTAP